MLFYYTVFGNSYKNPTYLEHINSRLTGHIIFYWIKNTFVKISWKLLKRIFKNNWIFYDQRYTLLYIPQKISAYNIPKQKQNLPKQNIKKINNSIKNGL